MKKGNSVLQVLTALIVLCYPCFSLSQEIPQAAEQLLENLAVTEQTDPENSQLPDLDHFRKNPVNLNTAGETELQELSLLTALQVNHLLTYRRLLGRLVSIYELQAIPSWDLATIRMILPYITITDPTVTSKEFAKRFRGGEQMILVRASQVLELPGEFKKPVEEGGYRGGAHSLLLRFRYAYKNLLQIGILADKDAGESFGTNTKGFDFYSFHLFARKLGLIQSLAIGDFTINLGQGLVHWQGPGLRKSSEVISVKLQSPVLRPYSGSGEFYFHRGVGITIRRRNLEGTGFVSFRKLDANTDQDERTGTMVVTSFITSGYHRTLSEINNRNVVTQLATGGNLAWHGRRWKLGLNTAFLSFSIPLQKREEPYNLFAFKGKNAMNVSMDFNFTWKNIHFFGEAAGDRLLNRAIIAGLMASLDPAIDISFVQRLISPRYQSLYGNAFTENSLPTNENGTYIGVTIKPASSWRIDAYSDIVRFPWLKYMVDAPAMGTDYLVQLLYRPGKQVEIYSRYRTDSRQMNQENNGTATNFLVHTSRKTWRTQVNLQVNTAFTLRNRIELVWAGGGRNWSRGFSTYMDILYKPMMKPFSVVSRFQFFETDDYDSRVYAYENDVLLSYSIPALSNAGCRYYFSIQYDVGKITCWLKWAQTIYNYPPSLGSGLDGTRTKKRTDIKLQMRYTFN